MGGWSGTYDGSEGGPAVVDLEIHCEAKMRSVERVGGRKSVKFMVV